MKKVYYIILTIVLVIIAIFSFFKFTMVDIYVDGKHQGDANNIFEAKKMVNEQINRCLQAAPGAMVNNKITYKITTKISMPYRLGDTQTHILLGSAITAQVPCTIIVVNGEPLLGLPTKDNAGEFLIAVKDKYKLPGCEEPEIKENITIDNSAIDLRKYFKTVESAVEYASAEKMITVVVRKPFNKEVVVPQKTVKVSSTKIPFGKQKVISKGSPGKKIVTGYTVFENGKKVKDETTHEEFLVQPVPKQIAIGI